MRQYGLIGYPLSQSFSKKYFAQKFAKQKIVDAEYELYEIDSIEKIGEIILFAKNLKGLNVTIPYKEKIIPYLKNISQEAGFIGACNCIKVIGGELYGFNTDAPAFLNSLKPLLKPYHRTALVLGTGGAAKAVCFALQNLEIAFVNVSREKKDGVLTYDELTAAIMADNSLIINTTPLGSFPKVESHPSIPYEYITDRHLLYDLVYNPAETVFLKRGKEKGAVIKNGYEMLVGQAELSWNIWNT